MLLWLFKASAVLKPGDVRFFDSTVKPDADRDLPSFAQVGNII